jgi:hypothetical protein
VQVEVVAVDGAEVVEQGMGRAEAKLREVGGRPMWTP